RAVARPMPLDAPVITTTESCIFLDMKHLLSNVECPPLDFFQYLKWYVRLKEKVLPLNALT
ncbi:MAG: hypothetical protein ACJ8BW_09145, partial [Ktedonobacteraceae bacterium]